MYVKNDVRQFHRTSFLTYKVFAPISAPHLHAIPNLSVSDLVDGDHAGDIAPVVRNVF